MTRYFPSFSSVWFFFSFYQEKNQKKIVVARNARCSRLYASATAFKERAPTFCLLIQMSFGDPKLIKTLCLDKTRVPLAISNVSSKAHSIKLEAGLERSLQADL
jgi:hypothetical protein